MKNKGRIQFVIVISLQVIVIILSLLFGYFVGKQYGYTQSEHPILTEAASLLDQYGLYSPGTTIQLEYGMIRGMLQSYNDPYSAFYEPVQHELQTNQFAGVYGGIGSGIEMDSNANYFLYPYPDSPAAQAAIPNGAQLLNIEELSIQSFSSIDEIAAAIRGEVGTRVSITIAIPPEYSTQKEVKIRREEFSLPSVHSFLAQTESTVGIIQLDVIAESTPAELSTAIEELSAQGADSFIIDLRNNGGGILDAGIDLASLFLTKDQIIIRTEEKNSDPEITFNESTGIFSELPIVILVNENTASAAEIFSGALQANQRCLLIGKQTYGKNTIQLVFELQDTSSIHITNAQWGFPTLPEFTSGNGLIPDIDFPDIDSFDPVILEKAVEVISQKK